MFIDTPGHDCFTDQRLVTTQISDIIILLVDINKGIRQTTIECIELLKKAKRPFIVGLNKLDKLNGWVSNNNKKLKGLLKIQEKKVIQMLDNKIKNIKLQFSEQGLNTEVYYKNKNSKEYISLVPISGKTGDGIPDLFKLVEYLSCKFLIKN